MGIKIASAGSYMVYSCELQVYLEFDITAVAILVIWSQKCPYFERQGGAGWYPDLIWLRIQGQTMVATCHSQDSQTESTSCFIVCSTLNGNIIHKMNFMLDWRRLETRDREHTLVRKRFTEVEYQVRCRVIYHKHTYNQTYFETSRVTLGDCRFIMLW